MMPFLGPDGSLTPVDYGSLVPPAKSAERNVRPGLKLALKALDQANAELAEGAPTAETLDLLSEVANTLNYILLNEEVVAR